MKFKKLFASAIFAAMLPNFVAAHHTESGDNIRRDKSFMVMEFGNAASSIERHADKHRYPASLTKLMTALLAFEAIERGELDLQGRLSISDHVETMTRRPDLYYTRKTPVYQSSRITVDGALQAVIVVSSNNLSVALAEAIAGSERSFADRMNERARQLGMDNTFFVNASGLPDPGLRQVTTATDMAILAHHILEKFPQYAHYFSQNTYTHINGASFTTHNRLVRQYSDVDGMKTGYIRASGSNLVATAKRGDRRLIVVYFGGESAGQRNRAVRRLLNNAFAQRAAVAPVLAPQPPTKPRQPS